MEIISTASHSLPSDDEQALISYAVARPIDD